MNGVANITEKIQAEARSYAEEQLALAKDEAETLKRDYADQAAAVVSRTLAEAKENTKSIAERGESKGAMDRRKLLLGAKQDAINEAFQKALSKMSELPDEDKILMMVKMGVKYQTQDAEYIFNKKDRETFGAVVVETVNAVFAGQQAKETFSGNFIEQIKKLIGHKTDMTRATLSEKTGDFAGGFILKQGDIESNCTFEVLIGGVREGLEAEVSSILFA